MKTNTEHRFLQREKHTNSTRRVIRTHIWATAYIPPGVERYTSHDIHSLTHAKTSPVKWLLWMPPVRMGSPRPFMFSWIKPLWLSLRYLAPPNTHTHAQFGIVSASSGSYPSHFSFPLSMEPLTITSSLLITSAKTFLSRLLCWRFSNVPFYKNPTSDFTVLTRCGVSGFGVTPNSVDDTSDICAVKGWRIFGRLQQTIVLICDFFLMN